MDEPEDPAVLPSIGDLSWEDGERLSARQNELHPSIDRVRSWAADHPDLFAGVWLDNDQYLLGTGPVRMVVATTHADPRAVAPDLEALVDDADRLQIVHRPHSEALLRAAQNRFIERWMPQGQSRVTGCGIDTLANSFMVVLAAPDPALEDRIRADDPGVPIDFHYGHGYTAR